jgi:hypothetical protein
MLVSRPAVDLLLGVIRLVCMAWIGLGGELSLMWEERGGLGWGVVWGVSLFVCVLGTSCKVRTRRTERGDEAGSRSMAKQIDVRQAGRVRDHVGGGNSSTGEKTYREAAHQTQRARSGAPSFRSA